MGHSVSDSLFQIEDSYHIFVFELFELVRCVSISSTYQEKMSVTEHVCPFQILTLSVSLDRYRAFVDVIYFLQSIFFKV